MRRAVAAAVVAVALAACEDEPPCPDAGRDGGESTCPDASPDARTDWRSGPPLPSARLEAGVATLGGRVAVVGGFDPQIAIVATVSVFDPAAPAATAWTDLPAAPVAWTHPGLAGRGGSLYLLGGLEGPGFVPRGEAYVLDTQAGGLWTPLPAMPVARGAAGIAVGPTQIFVVGGADATAALAVVEAYDVGQGAWIALPPLPAPRSHPAAFALADGSLIVAGGLATLDAASAAGDTWRLDAGATTWRALDPMRTLTPRGGCAYGVIGVYLICAGGEAGTAALAVTEAYDVADDRWVPFDPMPEPRAGTQGAVVGSRLFVPGGARQLAFIPEPSLYIFER